MFLYRFIIGSPVRRFKLGRKRKVHYMTQRIFKTVFVESIAIAQPISTPPIPLSNCLAHVTFEENDTRCAILSFGRVATGLF